MTPQFTVYKKGVTNEPITILSKDGEHFNKQTKIEKYLSLGYTVKEIKL